ncbi:hypothetical protein BGZ57DRAFT_168755 [Hyaloscypha finlandica]|nr:hypothetical protein BGZ57DRAFT_168755 [Hyaloscypha finlandica]
MDPAFYVLSSGDEATGGSSPNTNISGSSHDTSSAKYHITDISAFAADLNEAAKAAFPNKGRSRYATVSVSLMRWQHDELGVEPELHRLEQKFQDYGFKTDVWLIPSRDSHLELMSKSIDLLRSADNDRNLFILYYAGHGRISSARQAEWTCGQGPDHASVDWSAIQSLFAKARSDVLILLDTCAAASSTMRSQYGTMEAIVACGFESRAAPPGEYSFTNTLIEVLDDWINKQTFSASCLHAEILFQLKLKETKKGREGWKLEWCTTPIHINYTADSKLPGIELCRRNIVLRPEPPPPSEIERPSTFTDVMDIDFDGSSTALSPLSSLTDSGEFQTPHVLIKIGLEPIQGPIDMKQCLRWLEGVPLLGKWAKVEGIYPSFSTLIVLSMPISVWNMLPDHPACTFIGYVTGPGFHPESAKAKGLSTEFLKGRLQIRRPFFSPEKLANSARRWSHRSLASNLKPLTLNTPKTLDDRLLDPKNDVPDSVQ